MRELFKGEVNQIPIEDELQKSYLEYAMSVIVGRALPDIRDGLKPVHRRILFAMNELNNVYNKPYKKSARIVGEVIGKFHPHGDSAVYDTIVRMAQDFSMRYPLIDGQGNFGSVDGDPPAAMRYTEIRMSKISSEFLTDIDKETVDFLPNYDSSLEEPVVLPTKIPNLLVNGSSGIAVGMATNIPPHNLTEIINALLAIIQNPEISIEELIKIVPAPDFPTYGIIKGVEGVKKAYRTGRGSVTIFGKTDIEEIKGKRNAIIINELPYLVNKAKLIEKIAEFIKQKKLEGISDIRDESNRKGMRIVIELKKDAQPQIILNFLYKHTSLKSNFGIILLGVLNNQPRVFNLKELLVSFLEHRREVVTRRTEYNLRKAKERAHILEGLKKAVENIDEVIKIIRGSKDSKEAKIKLIDRFEFTPVQAQAILDLRLHRLTSLEITKLIEEYNNILKLIAELQEILDNESRLMEVISEELIDIRERYGDERRTAIEETYEEISNEDMIPDEEVVVTITKDGYIKRTPLKLYKNQRRGGKGKSGIATKDSDVVKDIFIASTKDFLLLFTNRGRVYWKKVFEVPQPANLNAKGRAIINLLSLSYGERVLSVLPVKTFDEGSFVVMATSKGLVKKTSLTAYSNPRSSGIIAVKLEEGDQLVTACLTKGDNDILLATKKAKVIRFHEDQIRATGRNSIGVTGIKLSKQDKLVSMEIISSDGPILTISEHGFGKRTPLKEYVPQKRGGKGRFLAKITEKTGLIVDALQVKDNSDLIISTDNGRVIRISVSEISINGRVTQGVKLVNINPDKEKVVSVTLVKEAEVEDDENSVDEHGIFDK